MLNRSNQLKVKNHLEPKKGHYKRFFNKLLDFNKNNLKIINNGF